MYSVSALWDSIISGDHWFETKVEIDGVTYDQTKIIELTIQRFVFAEDHPDVGSCLSSEITLSVLPSSTIPRMASIEPFVRVKNSTQTSEWIPQGVYYIDTRETTQNDGVAVLSLHGYDAMLMTEQMYPETTMAFPADDTDVVQEIADTIGVSVDSRTWDVMVHSYQISLPADYSMREVLGYIGAMYAGNWVMTYDGELLLVALGGIPPETNYLIDHNDNPITFGGGTIHETLTGSSVSFIGDGSAFDDVSVAIEPVQSGSGDPSPSNIRPITGFSSVNVYVVGDTSETTTVNMPTPPGTVYGGTLDVVTGVLTVDRAAITFNGTEAWGFYSSNNPNGTCFRTAVSGFVGWTNGAKDYLLCNCFKVTSMSSPNQNDAEANSFWINNVGDGLRFVWGEPNQGSTAAEFKTWLSSNNVTVVAKITTPQIYQLTSEEIATLEGEQTVHSDAGNITVTYTYTGEAVRILV